MQDYLSMGLSILILISVSFNPSNISLEIVYAKWIPWFFFFLIKNKYFEIIIYYKNIPSLSCSSELKGQILLFNHSIALVFIFIILFIIT